MKRLTWLAFVLGAALAGCSGGREEARCGWVDKAEVLTLPKGEVKGVLRGASKNASTTCTRDRGTGGPEAVYALRLTERTLVELEVTSRIDTVLAIRQLCDDPATEVACSDNSEPAGNVPGGAVDAGVGADPIGPPPPSFDAGVPLPTPSRDARLRTALDPGTYFVLVDEAAPFGVGGEFTLRVSTSTPPAQTSCQAPLLVADGTHLAAESLDLAGTRPPSCSASPVGPALFYTADIPSGQRLTARARATRGDRSWQPVLQVMTACNQASCLGFDRPSDDAERVLRHVNNGPNSQRVILSVGANTAVSGGVFTLDIGIGEPVSNGTCTSARPVTHGQVLRGQDLAEGQLHVFSSCKPPIANSLFYSVRVLPRQTLTMTAQSRNAGFDGNPVALVLYDSCDPKPAMCQISTGTPLTFTNHDSVTRTVIVEATTFNPGARLVFDLMVDLPLPPGQVIVAPTDGLVTSEAGQTATFDVTLGTPPTELVTIPIASTNPGEGTAAPAQLTFDTKNWDKPQRVTVTGANDDRRDGPQVYVVRVAPAESKDVRYAGLDGDDVALTNYDDEPGFVYEGSAGLSTAENGAAATFKVRLNRMPKAMIRLPVASSDPGEATVSPAALVFEPQSWNVAQTVTVTGVDDTESDGVQAFKVLLGAVESTDADWAGIDPPDVEASNNDDDHAAIAPYVISTVLSCPHGGNGQRIGADGSGNIYVAMFCTPAFAFKTARVPLPPDGGAGGGAGPMPAFDGGMGGALPPRDAGVPDAGFREPQLHMVISYDGGRSFRSPTMPMLGGGTQVHLSGGGPGEMFMVVAGDSQGMVFGRTTDAGSSWTYSHLMQFASDVRVARSGSRLAVIAHTNNGVLLWHSIDGGETFETHQLGMLAGLFGIGIQPDGSILLMVGDGIVRRSVDGGKTFDAGTSIGMFAQDTVFGRTRFYANLDGQSVYSGNPAAPAMGQLVSGFRDQGQFVRQLLVDPNDGLAVIEGAGDGTAMVRWLDGTTKVLSMARGIGPTFSTPAGIALSGRAVAFTIHHNGQVWFGLATRP